MSQFKLCAFADEAGADIQDQIQALNDNNIPFLEVRGVADRNFTKLSIQEAKELKTRLASHDIRIWSIGSPLGKIGITDDFGPHMELFLHTLELARAVEAQCIRLFSFFIPSDKDAAIYRNEVMERLSRFSEAAKGSGVTLCHENEKGIYGDNADRCFDIHRQLPALAAIFDPANFVQCNQDTIKAWELLSPYVKYMHIKDAIQGGAVVPAGKGNGNLPYLLEKYKLQGGTVLTLEPHLKVFSGFEALENGEKISISDEYSYPSQRAAFDAAVSALRVLI
ncbi:MAG TPA: xylose isomerase [Ruminococcaceae bacterium]|jgi:sugar phosphate isomerase/epimerase|nr:xylose isomerase [Oscillospiraceae bacterium]